MVQHFRSTLTIYLQVPLTVERKINLFADQIGFRKTHPGTLPAPKTSVRSERACYREEEADKVLVLTLSIACRGKRKDNNGEV